MNKGSPLYRPSSIRRLSLYLLLALLLPVRTTALPPGGLVHKADKRFDDMAYSAALEIYRTAVERGHTTEHVYRRIGQCYMKLGKTPKAKPWYALLVKMPGATDADIIAYADVLKATGEVEEAERWLQVHASADLANAREKLVASGDALERLSVPSAKYRVFDAGVNTTADEFSPTWVGNGQVLFSTSREHWGWFKYNDAWTGDPFTELFQAKRDAEGNLYEAEALTGGMNSMVNEGPATCDQRSRDLYFTANMWKEGGRVQELGIMRAESKGDYWQPTAPLWDGKDRGAAFHPAISHDGKVLIFASDRPGGLGGADLYVSHLRKDGWSLPELLQGPMNTGRDELFPYIANDGRLYFASSGHLGLGGLDIFVSEQLEGGGYGPPENMGAPINSASDDLGLIIDAGGRNGYFTSNRPRGIGGDDIYGFEVVGVSGTSTYACAGKVIDATRGVGRIGVTVMLCDEHLVALDTAVSGANGEYSFDISAGQTYALLTSEPGLDGGVRWILPKDVANDRVLQRDLFLLPARGIWLRGSMARCDSTMQLQGVEVVVTDTRTQRIVRGVTDEGGYFKMELEPETGYEIMLQASGHWSDMGSLKTGKESRVIELSAVGLACLEPLPLTKAQPLALGSEEDTPGGLPVAMLLARLIAMPDVEVELQGYTGGQGHGKAAITRLEEELKRGVADLVAQGIDRSRLTWKVYDAVYELGANRFDDSAISYIVTSAGGVRSAK